MIVIDSCALVEMARQTEDGCALQMLVRANEAVISCELLRAELTSVYRKFVRTEGWTAEQAQEYFSRSIDLVDKFYSIESLQTEALAESIRLDHSTYDLFYFVLARRTGATLFTLDRKLMQLCMDNGVKCIAEVDLEL